mmetsp:Transcript_5779/g.13180  ORF Transcript_5779/g.13180 Transcript_5779/m.13180 type:complete len:205 (-) Transcript_5779:419-1033(-)
MNNVTSLVKNGTALPTKYDQRLFNAPFSFFQYVSIKSLSYTNGKPSPSMAVEEESRDIYDLSTEGAVSDFMDTAAFTAAVAMAAAETAPELVIRSARLFFPLAVMESNDSDEISSNSDDESSSSSSIFCMRLSVSLEDVIFTPLISPVTFIPTNPSSGMGGMSITSVSLVSSSESAAKTFSEESVMEFSWSSLTVVSEETVGAV